MSAQRSLHISYIINSISLEMFSLHCDIPSMWLLWYNIKAKIKAISSDTLQLTTHTLHIEP